MADYLDQKRRCEREAVIDRMWRYWRADPHATLGTVAGKALDDVGRDPNDIRWLFPRTAFWPVLGAAIRQHDEQDRRAQA